MEGNHNGSKSAQRKSGFLKRHSHPRFIKETTVNKINLFSQMQELKLVGSQVYTKYEKIITELQSFAKELYTENNFLKHQNQELLQENLQLRQRLETNSSFSLWNHSQQKIIKVKKTQRQFLIQEHSPPLQNSPNLDPGFFPDQCFQNLVHSHFQQVEKSYPPHQEVTPMLGSRQTWVECTSVGNQAPLRVFYLLLLQKKASEMLEEFKNILLELQQYTDYQLFPFHSDNKVWIQVLREFLAVIKSGELQDELDVVGQINENTLLDILLISVLRYRIGGLLEDKSPAEETSGMQISHKKLFYGLGSQFNLRVEKNQKNNEYLFYPETHEDSLTFEKGSQNSSIEISVQNRTFSAKRHAYPLFKVKFNKQRKVFQFPLDIKYKPFQYEPENASFKVSDQEDQENSDINFESAYVTERNKQNLHYSMPPLREILHLQNIKSRQEGEDKKSMTFRYMHIQESYLHQEYESKEPSEDSRIVRHQDDEISPT